MRGLQASGLASLALRLWSPRGARLWGSRDHDAALPGAEGRRGGRSAGEGRALGVCCFSAAFQGAVEKAGRRARHTEQQLRPHDHLHQLRGDANSEIYGGSSPSPMYAFKRGGVQRCHIFFFLSPQWPLHLEQVGEDVPISTSRVSCEARRRETPGTRPGRQGCPALCRRGPSLLAGGREARGGAGRKSCALPARGRCGPRLRPGPGSGGPGASRATDGRRATPPWRDLPRSRVGLIRGRGRLFPGHLSKTYAGRELSLILSYQPGLRWGF